MLTRLTQTALVVLNDIACGEISPRLAAYDLFPSDLSQLLSELEVAGLIRLRPGEDRTRLLAFALTRPTAEISLLDVLEATGEYLNCNRQTDEEMYLHYGLAARKLGVVNHMTRLYLSEIKLTDL